MNANVIPVVLFAYARSSHLERVLECLRQDGVPLIYAFSDGPKGEHDRARVDEVRALLGRVDWCEIHITQREHNFGLGASVLRGVTEVSAQHDAFIVCEDDLIFAPGTYAWMCAALRHYATEPRVMSVSAWGHPRVTPQGTGLAPYFDGRAECWLWGSWARAWQGMAEENAVAKMAVAQQRGIAPGAYGADLPQMAEVERAGRIWAVRWLYHHLQHGGLCLRPPWALSEHAGFDASATNAQGAALWASEPLRPVPPIPEHWPQVTEDPACRELWQRAEPATAATTGLVKRLAGNSIWSLLGWAASMLLGFVVTPIQLRLLGQDQYGLMVLLSSLISPMLLLDFGMGEATIKFVAESWGAGDVRQAEKYIQSTLAFNLGMGLLGSGLLVAASQLLITRLFNIPEASHALAHQCLCWLAAVWFCNQARQTFVGAVTARQRYRLLNLGTILASTLTALAGLATLLLGGGLLEFTQVQAASALAQAVGWVIAAKRLFPGMRFTPSLDRQAFSRTFGYGMWQMLNYLGGILSGQSQKWLLGISLTVASVGFYNVALQLNTLCYLVAYRIGQVLFPAVSELQGRGEDEYAARLTFNVSWLVGCVAISGLLTLAVFVPDVLTLWIGPEISAEATGLTRVLAVASAVGGVFAVPSNYLLGIGRVRWLAALALTQGAISLVAAALLVPRFGLIGAGWAYTLGTAAHVATLVLIWTQLVRRWIGAWAYFWGVFGPCLLGLLFGTGLVLARDSMPTVLNEWQLGIAAVACACAGLALLLVIDRRLPGGGARSALVGQLLGSVSAQLRARLRTGREVLP